METDKPPATEVEIAAATKEPEKEIEEKDEKKGKEEKEDGELAADRLVIFGIVNMGPPIKSTKFICFFYSALFFW